MVYYEEGFGYTKYGPPGALDCMGVETMPRRTMHKHTSYLSISPAGERRLDAINSTSGQLPSSQSELLARQGTICRISLCSITSS